MRKSNLSHPPRSPAPTAESDERAYDVIVLGSGPAGSVLAATLARAGWSVLVIEPRQPPTPVVGERIGGVAAQMIRTLGLEASMEARRFPISEGVEILGRDPGVCFEVPMTPPGWQVRRADFEQLLLQHAIAQGATHRRGDAVRVETEGSRVVGLIWESASVGSNLLRSTPCRTLVDASGRDAFLSRQAIAGSRTFESGFQLVLAQAAFHPPEGVPAENPLAACVYYDRPGHWARWTPISDDLVSVGIAVPRTTYQRHAKTPALLLEWGIEKLHPALRERLIEGRRASEVHLEQIAPYRMEPFVGEGWLCLGLAHRQVDPFFSFDVSLAMAEGEEAGRALLAAPHRSATPASLETLRDFVDFSERAHDTAQDLTRYFWRFPGFFRQLVDGRLGEHFLDLLGGRALHDPDQEALRVVRGRLTASPLEDHSDRRAAEIAHRVKDRYEGADEVQAAFLELGNDGACLSLVIDETVEEEALLHDFEESLYQEFGRDYLVVIRWSGASSGALSAPDFEGAQRIFDRRAS